jgi:Concanavalin A-like lectin/glucanases superfamily
MKTPKIHHLIAVGAAILAGTCLFSSQAKAAVSVVATKSSALSGVGGWLSAASTTWNDASFQIPAGGTGGMLVVMVGGEGAVTYGVTWSGTALTQAAGMNGNGSGNAYVFYLANPAPGTGPLVVTRSVAGNRYGIAALYATGVVGEVQSAVSGAGGAATLSATTARKIPSGSLVVSVGGNAGGAVGMTLDSGIQSPGAVQLLNTDGGLAGGSAAGADYLTNAPGGTTLTATWTENAGAAADNMGVAVVAFGANPETEITLQPVSATNWVGRSQQFAVAAAGTPPLSYQWYMGTPSGSHSALSNGGQISGATATTLSISNLVVGNSTNYYVVITNTAWGAITSSVVSLSVFPITGIMAGEIDPLPPVVDLTAGGTLDWIEWGYPDENSFDHKVGGTNQISDFTMMGAGAGRNPDDSFINYTWSDGTTTPAASENQSIYFSGGTATTVSFTVPAGIIPKVLTVYAGAWNAVANLRASLSDNSVPPFAGSFNTGGGAGSIRAWRIQFGAGSAGQTLTVTANVGPLNGGDGGIELGAATLVSSRPLTVYPQPVSQSALTGGSATFAASAIGLAPISYQWQANNGSAWGNLVDGGRISGATTNRLTISSLTAADATQYRLVVQNSGGANSDTSSVVSLTVLSEAVAMDFSGDDSSQANVNARKLAAANVAGALPQANWNWVNNQGGGGGLGTAGTSDPLNNHLGTATTVRLLFEGNDAWYTAGGEIADNDGKMMKGILKHEGSDPGIFLTFTNLSTGTYDVYLYGNNDDGNSVPTLSVTVGGQTYYWSESLNFQGVFIEAALSTDQNNPGAGNYLHFTGLSPDPNGTIAIACAWISGGNAFGTHYIGIAGVQLAKPTGSFSGVPVSLTQEPRPSVLYAGGTAHFTAGAVSSYPPLTYRWQANSGGNWANLANGGRISGATSASLAIANVGAADALSYRVIVNDGGGNSITSSVATLTIAASPVANSYPAGVLADKPLAYYRLDEAVGETNVYDYVGNHNGLYYPHAAPGSPGVPNPPYAGFEAGNLCFLSSQANSIDSDAVVPFGTLAGMSNVTFIMWIYPNMPQGGGSAGLIVDRSGAVGGGLMYNGSGDNLQYQWNARTFDSGLAVPVGMWSFCALVISPSGANLYLFNANGLASTNDPTPLTAQTFGNDWRLGQDPDNPGTTKAFDGLIDEVAIYGSALSADQINRLYLAAAGGVSQGISISKSAGNNVVLTWSQGVLLQAPAVTGPWTTNSAATSPYTNAAAGSQFYRLQIPVVP